MCHLNIERMMMMMMMKLQSQTNVPSKPDYRQPGTVIKTFAKVSDLAVTPAMVSDSLNFFKRIFYTRLIQRH